MSNTQDNLLQQQLAELVKVGVGGKFKDTKNAILHYETNFNS